MRCINVNLALTGQIHKLTLDYLTASEATRLLYDFEPDISGAAASIEGRKKHPINRQTLVTALNSQYSGYNSPNPPSKVFENIHSLLNENTFTVTTGHQLSIFTGPLFYIYKLVSVIKYSQILKDKYPEYHFVPIYWMASEDHDFEEINHFHIWGKTLTWDEKPGGAVGRMNPNSLKPLIDEVRLLTSNSPKGEEITEVFRKAYLEHDTLADAARYIVNELFNEYGLVVIDGDDPELKKALIPVFEQDIFENRFYTAVNDTISNHLNEYKLPLSPREINVFYLGDQYRNRIISEGGKFKVIDSDISWTPEELKTEINTHPEHFSPNVILRPMYQELILPNMVYIGGNNEIAYWLELKNAFKSANVFYPQLLVRDSGLFVGKKASEYLNALKIEPQDLFLSLKDLQARFYEVNDMEHVSEKDSEELLRLFDKMRNDIQGLPSDLAANIVKQLNLQVKEVKKWKNDIHQKQLELQEKSVAKLEKIYNAFYPEGEMQERYDNFIPYYLQYGREWLEMLRESCSPLSAVCHIFIEE